MQVDDKHVNLEDIVIVRDLEAGLGEGWMGVYYKGKLLRENDDVDLRECFSALKTRETNMEALEIDSLPYLLEDLPDKKEAEKQARRRELMSQLTKLNKELTALEDE